MGIRIRQETPSDIAAIEAVTVAAFLHAEHADHTEHRIVDALRRAGRLSVSLVADDDGVVIGHVAMSPVTISDASTGWHGLGPLSVVPERQGQGVGAMLAEQALGDLRRLGAAGCVVLGEPAYYARFGFRPVPSVSLPGVPPRYFQALSFNGSFPHGTVAYHESFATQG